ncbi:predicted transcriptional regulator [Paenibacillus popilliae ATCC 14706]|uniref:Predicted transcriptional regulator n=1 Tax=Paenibacillus popilliae ATCC 14706 TaxID=1212764 RepID=M9LIN3_PAEPP|nr:predicted transcriptional regulator [Paenibacillus popilliae ATCC 14706]
MPSGGYREGSGRKRLSDNSLKRVLSITMSADEWERIDNLIAQGFFESKSEYFRKLHESQFASRDSFKVPQ